MEKEFLNIQKLIKLIKCKNKTKASLNLNLNYLTSCYLELIRSDLKIKGGQVNRLNAIKPKTWMAIVIRSKNFIKTHDN